MSSIRLMLIILYISPFCLSSCGDGIKESDEQCDQRYFSGGCVDCIIQPEYNCYTLSYDSEYDYTTKYYSSCYQLSNSSCGDGILKVPEECDEREFSGGCINCIIQPGFLCQEKKSVRYQYFSVCSRETLSLGGTIGVFFGSMCSLPVIFCIIYKICFWRSQAQSGKQEGYDNFPIRQLKPQQIDLSVDCAICLQSNCTSSLECKHVFHRQCITEWLQNHNSCPVCRALPTQPHLQSAENILRQDQ